MSYKSELTPFLGDDTVETSAAFMNMKFGEVLGNTDYNKHQINILSADNLFSRALYKINNNQVIKIGGYGDSVVNGYGATTPWPTVLQSKMRKICKNENITVVNHGHDNWESKEGLANIADVIADSPDLVIISFGINDCNGTMSSLVPVDLETYINNIEEMCDTFISNGTAVILLTPNPVLKTIINHNLNAYCDALRGLAEKKGIKLIDINKIYDDIFLRKIKAPIRFLSDEIHPNNDEGLPIIADNIIVDMLDIKREATSIPFAKTKYCRTDIAGIYNDESTYYKSTYFYSDAGAGTYIICPFFVNSREQVINLETIIYNQGASYNVRVDGNIVKEINAYNVDFKYNAQLEVGRFGYGLHYLEILKSDKTLTSSGEFLHMSSLKLGDKSSISLTGSWTNLGGEWAKAKVAKDGNKVTCSGVIKDGTLTMGTVIFTLPIECRPIERQLTYMISSTGAIVFLQVLTSGDVSLAFETVTASWFSLNSFEITI